MSKDIEDKIWDEIIDEVESFYKVKGKFSQNADLIRRVIHKTLNVVKSKQLTNKTKEHGRME